MNPSLLRVQHNAVRVCRKDILKHIAERDRVSSELCMLNLQNNLERGRQAVVHVLPCPIGSVPSVAEVPLNRVAKIHRWKELLKGHECAWVNTAP